MNNWYAVVSIIAVKYLNMLAIAANHNQEKV